LFPSPVFFLDSFSGGVLGAPPVGAGLGWGGVWVHPKTSAPLNKNITLLLGFFFWGCVNFSTLFYTHKTLLISFFFFLATPPALWFLPVFLSVHFLKFWACNPNKTFRVSFWLFFFGHFLLGGGCPQQNGGVFNKKTKRFFLCLPVWLGEKPPPPLSSNPLLGAREKTQCGLWGLKGPTS